MDAISVYEQRPWIKSYPEGVRFDVGAPEQSISEAFDKATDKWKNKTAIVFYGNEISYKTLRDSVDRFATALHDLGIRKGDRILILMLNSPEFIISVQGALKIGAIITPISPVYSSPEIKHQLLDSGGKTLICHDMLYEKVEKAGIKMSHVILVSVSDSLPPMKRFFGKKVFRGVYQKMAVTAGDIHMGEGFYKFKDLLKKYPPNPPRVEIHPEEDISFVLYTGGTTGLPKGVMINNASVMWAVNIMHNYYPLEEGKEVVLGYMPFYHIAGLLWGVTVPFLKGWKEVILTTPQIDDVIDSVADYEVTWFVGAPSIFEILKNYDKMDKINWKKLKWVASGADTLHESTAKDWKLRTGVTLQNWWGSTEIISAIFTHPKLALLEKKPNTIGLPMPATLAAILDPVKDEFVPVGEVGEIAISGPQVMKGYWNKPKELVKESQANINGTVYFRSGDLGTMDEDGYFFVYDRKNDLIKYKGLRVHSREVEDVIQSHPKIKEVGVIGVEDRLVGQNIKAFVVLEPDGRGKVSENDIITYCEGKLAHYKIPKIIEFLGELPKTDVGKVSRRELKEMEATDGDTAS
jgi:long-chain acyl-CoA synthetase